jgi:UDP-N-acetylmuramate: L-alanyl-gamma-D-glutamyl-meso-diaminopimelate ligase
MSTQLERLGIALAGLSAGKHFRRTATRSWSATRSRAATRRWRRCSTSGRKLHLRRAMAGRERAARARPPWRWPAPTARPPPPPSSPSCCRRPDARPGFLIGGVAEDFGTSARLGCAAADLRSREFVVEADEYDTAFFDKRSKFVHYRPLVAILNNLEYDHADIFPDLAAIQRQFHHLVRTVPRAAG